MATKPVSVRISAEGGAQVRAELIQVGDAGEQMGVRLSRGSTLGAAGLQNLGFQVQDFAVQVAGGTDASRALAQQLPQLLSGFGLLGVALGTTAAVLIPLAGYFLNAGEEAATAAERVDALAKSVDRLKQVNENFSLTAIDGLIEKYGELDAAVLLLISRQQKLAEEQALAEARDVTTGFQADFEGLFAFLDEYDSRLQQIAQATGATEAEAQSFGAIQDSVRFLNEEFGVTIEQARAIRAAVADLGGASGIAEAANAASRLSGLLQDSGLAGSELAQALLDAEDSLRQLNAAGEGIGGWLGAAITGAGDLAAGFLDAARAALSIPRFTPGTLDGGPDAARSAVQFGQVSFDGQVLTPAVTGAGLPTPTAPRSRGGGGGSRAQTDSLREAARIYDQTRTEAEKYSAEVAKLDGLLQSAAITQDTYNRALDDLKGGLSDAASYARSLENSFEGAFTSFVTGASSAREAASQLLGQLGQLFAQSAFRQLLGGGGFFGAVGGFLAGGRAGGGPVQAGQSYIVGERGPERVFMTGNGYVLPNEALRGGGSGGVTINVDARGAQEGVATQVAREVRKVVPEILRQSVNANRTAEKRGYAA